jgi:two-component system, cell cycle sensor histidine kinase and response regulator CckA
VETILVVDDEAEVLAIVREMLEGKGYQILDAPNAEEAVRVSSTSHSGPIHLLLTDIVMPGASGHDLAQQLSLQRPEMKSLYMSAFTLVMGQQQFSEAESGLKRDAPTILKPFTIERLAEKVKEVLAAKPRSPFDRPPDPWRNV